MLQYYAPVGVLVNQRGDVLYIHGHAGMYLEPVLGEAGLNILNMARDGLRQELTADLYKAVVNKEPVFHPGLRVKTNGDFTTVNLALRPVKAGFDAAEGPNLFLVTFEELPEWEQSQTGKATTIEAGQGTPESSTEVDTRIVELKRELADKGRTSQRLQRRTGDLQ